MIKLDPETRAIQLEALDAQEHLSALGEIMRVEFTTTNLLNVLAAEKMRDYKKRVLIERLEKVGVNPCSIEMP